MEAGYRAGIDGIELSIGSSHCWIGDWVLGCFELVLDALL